MPDGTRFQITMTATHPGRLATFWAAALGYEEEVDSPEYIARLREMGYDPAERPMWEAAINDPSGVGPRIYFEQGDRSAGGSEPHLDINVGKERAAAEAKRLEVLGARRRASVRPDCIEMEDPDGNRFCVQ
jgi:hypothetical protein